MADHPSEKDERNEDVLDSGQRRDPLSCVVAHFGVPTAVVVSYEDFYSLKAKAELLDHPEVIRSIIQSGAEILRGEAIPLEDAFATLTETSGDERAAARESVEIGRKERMSAPAADEAEAHRASATSLDEALRQLIQAWESEQL